MGQFVADPVACECWGHLLIITLYSTQCRGKLYEIACESWGQGDDTMRQKMSVMASAAAWGLGQWESMEEYVHSVPNNTMVYSLFQSVLHIHHGQFSEAQKVRKKEVGCLIVCVCVYPQTLFKFMPTMYFVKGLHFFAVFSSSSYTPYPPI